MPSENRPASSSMRTSMRQDVHRPVVGLEAFEIGHALKGEDIEGRERRIGDHVRQDPALAKVVIDNGHSVRASSFLVFGSRMRKRPRCARRPSQAAIISKEDSLPPHHVIFSRNVVTKCKSLRGTAHALTFAVGVIQSPFGPMPRDSAALLPPVTRLPAAG